MIHMLTLHVINECLLAKCLLNEKNNKQINRLKGETGRNVNQTDLEKTGGLPPSPSKLGSISAGRMHQTNKYLQNT